MKKTKTQKGITLVALIITIVVLLILAVVAITEIGDTGIIAHAENSAGKYNNSVTNETGILGTYEDFLSMASCEQHVWDSNTGKCTKCPVTCTHNWDEYVEVTAMSCITVTDGVEKRTCNQCGKEETKITSWKHTYVNGNNICEKCGEYCQHTNRQTLYDGLEIPRVSNGNHYHYIEEECIDCGESSLNMSPELYACQYMDANGKCTICGGIAEHGWYEGRCINILTNGQECGAICGHETYNGGRCIVCGYVCTHSAGYTNGKCITCEATCSNHDWSNYDGVCKNCEFNCSPHDWGGAADHDAYCNTCGYQCTSGKQILMSGDGWGTHTPWFRCDVCGADGQCGPEEECTYVNGVCTVCDAQQQ